MNSLSIDKYRERLDTGIHFDVFDLHPGGIQHCEGRLLHDLASVWGGPVFEIGVEYGNSSHFIAWGLKDSKLYSCDIQDVRYHKPHNQVFYPYASGVVYPPERCAWALIDGDHTKAGVISDIRHCVLNLNIRKLVFHDAREGQPTDGENDQKGTDVLEAALETLDDTWELTLLDSPCGILIAEKRCPTSPSD